MNGQHNRPTHTEVDDWPVELPQAPRGRSPSTSGSKPYLFAGDFQDHHLTPSVNHTSVDFEDADVEQGRKGKSVRVDEEQRRLLAHALDETDEEELLGRVEKVDSIDYRPLKGGAHLRRLFASSCRSCTP